MMLTRIGKWVALAVFASIAWASACVHQTMASGDVPSAQAAPISEYITQFRPPAEYRVWYETAAKCAGLKGDFDGIDWFVVPQPWATDTLGHHAHGEWRLKRRLDGLHRYIIVNAMEWRDSSLVMHESLHDQLYLSGWVPHGNTLEDKHPTPPFDKCAKRFWP